MGSPPKKKRFTIGEQIGLMRHYFPQFKYCGKRNHLRWIGILQPRDTSPAYHIRINYHVGHTAPKVFVLEPEIVDAAPHRYSDNSLCLYYPKDGSWSPYKLVVKTIVPWTVKWLTFYEIWLITDKWFGREAPHNPNK